LYHLKHQLAYLVVGLLCMIGTSHLTPHKCVRSRWLAWAFVGGIVAMLMCRWSPWAAPAGGSFCWLWLTPTNKIQPSEFVKVIYVLLLAGALSQPMDTPPLQRRMLILTAVPLGVLCVALWIQKDLGMMVLVVATSLGMLFIRGVSIPVILLAAVVLGAGGLGVAMSSPVRWARIMSFLDPESCAGGAGYQLCQMRAALARGGVGGLGLGMSPDKWTALPAAHTDSIFCVIGGELGLVGAVGVIVLFVALTTRAFQLAQRAGTPAAWYAGAGVGIMIAMQALINLGVATVSIPCTGLTLPFISYGGSSLMASLGAAGIVLAVSRNSLQPSEQD